MRIILVSPLGYPVGGIVTWTKEFLIAIKESKVEIILINTIKDKNYIKYFSDMVQMFKIFLKLLKISVKEKDILHINTSCAKLGIIRDYLIIKYIKKKKAKVVVQYHCNIRDVIVHNYQLRILNKIMKLSDINLVLNKDSLNFLNDLNKNIKVIILPNFISEERFKNLNKVKINDKIKKIVYTGHIKITKGCKKILEIAEKLPEIQFILVGKIYDNYFKTQKIKNVIYTGELNQKEVEKILKEADLFLFLSETEGFPNSILEAMSAGLPIIATKVGAIEDMLEEKEILIERQEKIENVISLIKKLDSSIVKRKDLSLKNIKKVERNYLRKKVFKELFKIYKCLI